MTWKIGKNFIAVVCLKAIVFRLMQLKEQQCVGVIVQLLRKRYQNNSACPTQWRRSNWHRGAERRIKLRHYHSVFYLVGGLAILVLFGKITHFQEQQLAI